MLLRLQGGGQDENGLGEGFRGDFSREVKDDTYYKRGDGRVVHKNNEYSQMIERRDLMAIESGKLVLVMVGLPGRGKSYISRRLELFMSWLGDKVKVFNVGQYRRNVEDAKCSGKANFFDPNNSAAAEIREQAAAQAMEDMLRFLDGAGQVAIYDATNSQQKRRQWIWNSVKARNPMHQVVCVCVYVYTTHTQTHTNTHTHTHTLIMIYTGICGVDLRGSQHFAGESALQSSQQSRLCRHGA
jgi:hypothetical protein